MGLFTSNKAQDYTIIVGCGRLGATLANTLSDEKRKTLVIDNRKEAFCKLSPSYGGLVLIGDATEIAVLTEAQIKKATSVLVVTNNDNTNILIAQMAKELFHIPQVLARLYNQEWDSAYRELGIGTIRPDVLSKKEVDEVLSLSKPRESAV